MLQAVGFPGSLDGKASAYNAGDPGSIPGSERSPGEGNGNPLQYSCLENPMDRGSWWATVHGVAKSRTRLSDFSLFFRYMCLWNQKLLNFLKFLKTYLDLEATVLILRVRSRGHGRTTMSTMSEFSPRIGLIASFPSLKKLSIPILLSKVRIHKSHQFRSSADSSSLEFQALY